MFKYHLVIILLIGSFQANAQTTFLKALYGSQEDIQTTNIDPQFSKNKSKAGKVRMNSSKSCTSNMQSSLPLRMVLGLLRGEGAVLKPSFDANSGTLSVYGGPMIGNCNSMLEFYLGEPDTNGDLPYTFEVRIKGCNDKKCKYKVQTMQDEKVVDLTKEIEVAPTMDGFIDCLKKTGVYNSKGINKSRIVTTELNVEKSSVSGSGEVWFASRGPAALNSGGGIYSGKNLQTNNDCYFYEDIREDGYTIFTKKDIKYNNLMREAQILCKSKDYEEIYGNLKNYENVSSTYKDLEKIMQKQLLKEVKKAKKEFDKAVKDGDLSDLDTEKYAKLFKDFHELIIEKHFDEDVHSGADENNMELLVNLYSAYEDAETKEEKADIEKKIRDLSKELNEFMEEPYFTLADYKYFVSMQKKAPLKDPKWKQATLSLHKSLISLRMSCQAYSVDNSSCSFSNKSKNLKDMATIESVNSRISSYSVIAEEKYAKKEYVLKNPDDDNSKDYAKMIKKCENLYSESNRKQMEYRQYAGQYNQIAMQKCQQKNPYMNSFSQMGGSYYSNKYKECVEDENYDFKQKYIVSPSKIKMCDSQISKYRNEYEKWKDLEDNRDEYYYNKKPSTDSTASSSSRNSNGSYEFSFNPGQSQMPQNNWYNQGYQQQQQSMNPYAMAMNPNQYSMYGNTGFGGRNPSMYYGGGMNTGMYGGGMNTGMYGGGMNTGMYGGGMNTGMYGGGMPPSYNNYIGNMSGSAGGPYNFTFGI